MSASREVELKDFIETTLINIAEGINRTNNKLKKDNNITHNIFVLRNNTGGDSKITGIQFDVAVTVSKENKEKSGFVVALVNIGGGAGTEKSTGNEMVQRIKFELGISSSWY